MTNSGDRHGEAEDALQSINKRTGRNMPQAVATGAVLVVVILASLLIRVDAFVVLIMIFMILGLWELRVDFATAGLHIPLLTLCLCSSASIVLTYYAPDHLLAMMLCVMATGAAGVSERIHENQHGHQGFGRSGQEALEFGFQCSRGILLQQGRSR
jgi:phosphatidate cytidylyltransferase